MFHVFFVTAIKDILIIISILAFAFELAIIELSNIIFIDRLGLEMSGTLEPAIYKRPFILDVLFIVDKQPITIELVVFELAIIIELIIIPFSSTILLVLQIVSHKEIVVFQSYYFSSAIQLVLFELALIDTSIHNTDTFILLFSVQIFT